MLWYAFYWDPRANNPPSSSPPGFDLSKTNETCPDIWPAVMRADADDVYTEDPVCFENIDIV